ncbi:tetratricopeptide repeat protein [Actinoplanes sp. NPDC051343]|uniref:tetratricopeptide repeat protein n=1 Tax=Actinoplanes sp. NPDC051343 TaxID=3363906 RepID=UPI0037A49CE9
MKTAQELWELLERAYEMPYGAGQIAVYDELLRQVDEAGDPDLAFTARLLSTQAYIYGGEPAKAFVTFSWCVSDFDNNPGSYHGRHTHTLLWLFKTMVSTMTKFPQVPLERTQAVLDDMERRYREGGHSLQAVYKHRYLVASHVGQAEETAAWFERWQATPRDELSDCAGCDPTSVASYLNDRGRYPETVALAEPVLAGRLTCTEQPQQILNNLMEAYLRTGEPEKAADAHRRAYRLERTKLADLWEIGTHIGFCARTGNEHRGLEILQRHIDWLEKAPSPGAEMMFAADAALLLRRLTELGHGELTVRRSGRDEITVAELAPEMAARARAVAARFDARNGTEHQSRLVEAEIGAQPYGIDLVLSPSRRPSAAPAPASNPEPLPEIPAQATAAELLDLAREHAREDRDAALAATLDELDARFGDLDDPVLAGRRLMMRGDVQQNAGDPFGMLASWEQAEKLFDEAGAAEHLLVARSRIALEHAARADGEIDDAAALAEIAYQEEHGGPLERGGAWSRLSSLRFHQGRIDEAVQAAERGQQFATESGRPRLAAIAALLRTRALVAAERIDEARTSAHFAWEFYRAHGPAPRRGEVATLYAQLIEDPNEQVSLFGETIASGARGPALAARAGRGRALMSLERPAEAIDDLVEAVALAAAEDLPEASAFARIDLAHAYRLADRPVEAAEVAEEALLRLDRLGLGDPANDVRFLLTDLYRALGDDESALTGYRELIERLTDNPAGRAQVGESLADLLYRKDRDADAAEAFGAAAADLHQAGDLIGELRALRRRVSALHFAGRPDEAEATARRVTELFDALPPEMAQVPNAIWQRWMTTYETGRVFMALERWEDAITELRSGVAGLRDLGALADADRLTSLLAEALFRAGEPAEAETLLRGVLERLPADAPERSGLTELLTEVATAAKDQPKRPGRRWPWS